MSEPATGTVASPARWRAPTGRWTYFFAMVGAGAVLGILGFSVSAGGVPFANLLISYGWLVLVAQSLLLGWWMGHLRPTSLLLGFAGGFWGMAAGMVLTVLVITLAGQEGA